MAGGVGSWAEKRQDGGVDLGVFPSVRVREEVLFLLLFLL